MILRRINGIEDALRAFASRNLESHADTIRTDGGGIYDTPLAPEEFAQRVIDDVRSGGDAFLKRISKAIDRAEVEQFEVPASLIDDAKHSISSDIWNAMQTAAERIRSFQSRTLPTSWRDESAGYGEIVQPIEKVGCCVPGGSAPLASTVLMTALIAKVAGVPYVSVVSPPFTDGAPDPVVLAACSIAQVDQVFTVGGAQAVAALAVGTETIPKVDMICGPGNIWVTAAKQRAIAMTGIDGIYGPTETMVIIDDASDPDLAAADLIAQAEHDPLAAPILVALSEDAVSKVEDCLELQLENLPRESIARAALTQRGAAVVVDTVDEALRVAAAFAPEHLCLAFRDARERIQDVRNAGGIFIGELSGEVMADYIAGPSHVMPTGGSARWASALSARDFIRVTPFLDMDEPTFLKLSNDASLLARAELLEGHARASEARKHAIAGE